MYRTEAHWCSAHPVPCPLFSLQPPFTAYPSLPLNPLSTLSLPLFSPLSPLIPLSVSLSSWCVKVICCHSVGILSWDHIADGWPPVGSIRAYISSSTRLRSVLWSQFPLDPTHSSMAPTVLQSAGFLMTFINSSLLMSSCHQHCSLYCVLVL